MPDGRPVCELRIASDSPGDNSPLYLDVATFDKQAQACAQYLAKGREVAFSGRLILREWKADDGSKRSKHSAIGRVEFIGGRPNGSNANGEQAQAAQEQAPGQPGPPGQPAPAGAGPPAARGTGPTRGAPGA